jgi:2-polyprenyl-6-methoxyphenol hydroxylase-like FAD-dependent oxidoreductase
MGAGRDYPPTDEDGFLAFARSLPDRTLHDMLLQAQPLSPPVGFRRTENRRRHFERMARRPEQFVVLGDAACAFNPIYAQGMTLSAQTAFALDECLRRQRRRTGEGLHGVAGRFHRRQARLHRLPWLLATGEDFRNPATEGGPPGRLTWLLQHYVEGVMHLAGEQTRVYLAFMQVFQMLRPPLVLLQPRVSVPVISWLCKRAVASTFRARLS